MKTRFKQVIAYIPLISNKKKLFISVLLVIFSFIIYAARSFSTDARICLFAMLLSFFGDVSLNCTPLNKRPHWLLYLGAVFFMAAHLAYASSFYWLIRESNQNFFNHGAIIACIFITSLFVSSVVFAIYSKSKVKIMTIIVFCLYTLIIGINFVTIYSYSWSFASATFIGALSFLISDFIIGVETVFKVKSDVLRKLVWIFYPIGQIVIIACR